MADSKFGLPNLKIGTQTWNSKFGLPCLKIGQIPSLGTTNTPIVKVVTKHFILNDSFTLANSIRLHLPWDIPFI